MAINQRPARGRGHPPRARRTSRQGRLTLEQGASTRPCRGIRQGGGACGPPYGAVLQYAISTGAAFPTSKWTTWHDLPLQLQDRDQAAGALVVMSQSRRRWTRSWRCGARPAGCREHLAICNTQGFDDPRRSTPSIYTHAGPGIAVSSTKAFLAQITTCSSRALPHRAVDLSPTRPPRVTASTPVSARQGPRRFLTGLGRFTTVCVCVCTHTQWMCGQHTLRVPVPWAGTHPVAVGALKLEELPPRRGGLRGGRAQGREPSPS